MSFPADERPVETYQGSCHCLRTRFTLTIPSLKSPTPRALVKCNCTFCYAHGLIMTHSPRSGLQFQAGEEVLQDYTIGKGTRRVRFCGRCGLVIGFDLQKSQSSAQDCQGEFIGVNARTLQHVNVDECELQEFDGRNNGVPSPEEKSQGQ